MGRILGIDYGDARIGFAVSDSSHTFAFTRDLLNLSSVPIQEREAQFFDYLKELIIVENVECIVLGYPLTLSETESEQTLKIKAVYERLKTVVSIPIHLVDEALSTKEAMEQLKTQKTSHKKIKQRLDSQAARVILQTYLES